MSEIRATKHAEDWLVTDAAEVNVNVTKESEDWLVTDAAEVNVNVTKESEDWLVTESPLLEISTVFLASSVQIFPPHFLGSPTAFLPAPRLREGSLARLRR